MQSLACTSAPLPVVCAAPPVLSQDSPILRSQKMDADAEQHAQNGCSTLLPA